MDSRGERTAHSHLERHLLQYESVLLNPTTALVDSKACWGDVRTTAEAVKPGDTFYRVDVTKDGGIVKYDGYGHFDVTTTVIRYSTTVLRRDKRMMVVENSPVDGSSVEMRSKDVLSPNELLFLKVGPNHT